MWTTENKQRKNFSIHSICALVKFKLRFTHFKKRSCWCCCGISSKNIRCSITFKLPEAANPYRCVRMYVFANLAMVKRLHVLKAIAEGKRNKSFHFILVFISVSRVLNERETLSRRVRVSQYVCTRLIHHVVLRHTDSIYLFSFMWKDFWSTLIQVDLYPHNFVFTKTFSFHFRNMFVYMHVVRVCLFSSVQISHRQAVAIRQTFLVQCTHTHTRSYRCIHIAVDDLFSS